MPSTRWIDHLTPLDAVVDGRQQPVPVTVDFDGVITIDASTIVAQGGEVSDVTTRLRRLPTDLEPQTAYVAVDDLLVGSPTVADDVISQQMTGLERDRVYRLEARFGPPANRRGASKLVWCVE